MRPRQRVVAPTASVNPALVTAGLELGLDPGRPISAVAQYASRPPSKARAADVSTEYSAAHEAPTGVLGE